MISHPYNVHTNVYTVNKVILIKKKYGQEQMFDVYKSHFVKEVCPVLYIDKEIITTSLSLIKHALSYIPTIKSARRIYRQEDMPRIIFRQETWFEVCTYRQEDIDETI